MVDRPAHKRRRAKVSPGLMEPSWQPYQGISCTHHAFTVTHTSTRHTHAHTPSQSSDLFIHRRIGRIGLPAHPATMPFARADRRAHLNSLSPRATLSHPTPCILPILLLVPLLLLLPQGRAASGSLVATPAAGSVAGPPALLAVPLPLSSVRLAAGSRLHAQQEANSAFLLHLDPGRLTCL